LNDGAAAIGSGRSFEKRGGVVAAQPFFQNVITGKGHTFPLLSQRHAVFMVGHHGQKVVSKSYAAHG
jgi:hypothetical protein